VGIKGVLPATRDKDSEGKCSCVCWRARRLGGRRGGQNLMPQGRVIRHNKWRHKKPGGKYGGDMVDMAGAYATKGRAKRTHDYEIKERYGDIGRDQQTAQCWNWLAQVYRKLSLYIHCTCMN